MGEGKSNKSNRIKELKEKAKALKKEVRDLPDKGAEIWSDRRTRRQEKEFRDIFENAPLGITYLDLNGRIERTNPAFASMLGYQRGELVGKTFEELTAQEDRKLSRDTFRELTVGKAGRRQIEKRYITRNGDSIWVNTSASLLEREGDQKPHVIVLVENIQARKIAEDKLDKTLKEVTDFKYALDASSIVAITDAEGTIIYANDLFCKTSGYSRKELIGTNHRIVNAGVHARSYFKKLWNTITAGQVWRGEICNRHKNGALYWVDTTIVPFLDAKGRPYQFVAIRRDITERKKAEEQLRNNEKRFRSIFENAAIGIGQVGLDGEIQRTNTRLREMLGYSDDFMRGIHFSDITHPDDIEKDTLLYRKLLEGNRDSYDDQIRYICKDGSILWGNVSFSLVRNSNREPLYAIGLIEDITAEKEAEKALRHSEQRFRDVVDASGEMIWESDPTYHFYYLSRRVHSILGYEPGEMKGRSIFSFIPEEEKKRIRQRFEKVKKAGESFRNVEVRMFHNDGSIRWLRVSGMPYFDTAGSLMGYRGVAADASSEHAYMNQLREAKNAAEIANRTKSEFLANVSHEIRTPLNAVLGFTNILSEIITDSQQQKYLEAISSSGQNLLNLLNDILDLSKIESGRLELEYNAVNMHQLFSEIQNIFTLKAEERDLLLLTTIGEQVPPALALDEVRLRQVLINLVGNAIKFTDSGQVTLSVKASPEGLDSPKYRLFFEVEDTGIGIPTDQQEHIFESFRQQSGQSNRKYGGTGLGLAISKRLVEKMGGQISLRSAPGAGSTFFFELPDIEVSSVRPELPDESAEFDHIVFDTATILVVDDVPLNNLLVREHLKRMGHKVLEASNGKDAVEIAQNKLPDLVLMDIKMPVMDGFEATRLLKDDPSTSHIPVIAHTASVLESSAEQFSKQRFNGFLKKPLNKQELINELKRFLPHHGMQVESAGKAKGFDPERWSGEGREVKLATEDRESLLDNLHHDWTDRWKHLQQSLVMGDVEKLAKDFVREGSRLNLALLSDYGQHLKQKVDLFDIEELEKSLALFPLIVEKLNNQLSNR